MIMHEIVKGRFGFFCPGCECVHAIDGSWRFNGDMDKPTIHPSVLAVGAIRCHSYVTDGMIQFLGDSEHALKGQTVPLPEFMYHKKGPE
jgi:hypothetical protein